ncbi:lipase 1 [Streptomyces canarius]
MDNTIKARATAHNFVFGDVRTTFSGHEICSGDSWLHSVNWLDIGEWVHPTASGQSGGYLPVLNNAA